MVARDGIPLYTTVLAIPFENLYLDPKGIASSAAVLHR
jgi:hypothetical protein